ncbi:arylformamidase [Catalinimonas alkaloidigena]|uniref:cyclase family protein n=1 Tax=Catalinimonas alkaloidigena TaxID=1075417 RepID=UPI0024064820|nr:cyclase family protein [Catalinimonas alkaloidigena]MDF9797917.1 arylformamidase [Catalinimonas alkaloidigena]
MPNIIDLTQRYHNDMPGVHISAARSLDEDGWNASTLEIYSHAGTHMDAPYHFGVTDERIDQIDPARFMGPAWIVRLGQVVPRQLIGVEDLGDIAEKVKAGDSLLLQSGWSQKIGSSQYRDELPRISEALAKWCVEKKINMLGVEPPSVADVNLLEEVTRIHQILLGGDVIILEGLVNLETIKASTVKLIALPLKIKDGDGAPARVIVIEE